jgi:phosphoribosyl 1,2-cyclic phosphodiesterase
MTTFSVQSGSNGNCIYYQSGEIKLLFDAGISYKSLQQRLYSKSVNPKDIDALFISHDHSDHTKSMGIFFRKIRMPIFVSPKTFARVESRMGYIDPNKIENFIPNDTITIKHISVKTIRTPHDGCEPAIFIIDDGKTRVGIFTDLGFPFPELANELWNLDVVYMESNYDLEMLRYNPAYPLRLKQRIVGNGGHIDNTQSARLIKANTEDRLRHLFLSHLSENNNTPELALSTHKKIYSSKNGFRISIAPRYQASDTVYI